MRIESNGARRCIERARIGNGGYIVEGREMMGRERKKEEDVVAWREKD